MANTVRKVLSGLVKVALSLAIIGYLLGKAASDKAFADLAAQPKDWWLLAVATAFTASSVMLTHIRWYYLGRALGLNFRLRDAFRLGFLGYLFNLAPLGVVGGDLLKAVLLGRQLQGQRAKALATVIIDRVLGLYMLFVVSSLAILITGFWNRYPASLAVCATVWAITALGTVALLLLFSPLTALPPVHHTTSGIRASLIRLVEAVRMYRHQGPVMFLACLLTIGVHLCSVLSVTFVNWALYDRVVSLADQTVVVTISSSTGALPLPFGPFELVLELLYKLVGMPPHQGLIVALAFRVITVLIAAVGMGYYLASRAEVAQGIHEAEIEPIDENHACDTSSAPTKQATAPTWDR